MSIKFNAKLFDELEPCFPDMELEKGTDNHSVSVANGTYAGVNIVMSGLTPGIPVTINVKGDTTAFKLFNMIPVPVEVNTGAKLRSEYLRDDHNKNVIRRAPFMVYEALEPIYNIVMPTLTTMAFNFKTIIEYVKVNCMSVFVIEISHNGYTIPLTLNIEKYKFTVPKASKDTHKFINWFSFKAIANCHSLVKWSDDFYKMLGKYLRVAAFTRQNMVAVPLNEFFEVDGKNIILNEERLERFINIAKKEGIYYFQGGAVSNRALNLADDDDFYNSIDHTKIFHSDEIANIFKERAFDYFDNGINAVDSICGKPIPGDGEKVVDSVTKQLYKFILKHNLQENFVQCALDEPNDALCNAYKIITTIIKKNMSGIAILEPVLPTEEVVGCLDIWCPSLDVYENNRDFFDKQVEQCGDRLFVYACLTPGGNYCNRLLDLERLRIVWLAWAPAKYTNIEGFLHWGGNYHTDLDPFKRSAAMFSESELQFHPKRAMFLPAGDNCIFYPGHNQPLISIRSEAHRIGFEDLCMLEELNSLDIKKADQIISAVFRSYNDYEKSVEKYRIARKLLLQALSE